MWIQMSVSLTYSSAICTNSNKAAGKRSPERTYDVLFGALRNLQAEVQGGVKLGKMWNRYLDFRFSAHDRMLGVSR